MLNSFGLKHKTKETLSSSNQPGIIPALLLSRKREGGLHKIKLHNLGRKESQLVKVLKCKKYHKKRTQHAKLTSFDQVMVGLGFPLAAHLRVKSFPFRTVTLPTRGIA
jgi:hypothetical protein